MNTETLSEMRHEGIIKAGVGMHIPEIHEETIRLLINKYSPYVISTKKNLNTGPTHEEIYKAIDHFDGSYQLSLFIGNICKNNHVELSKESYVKLANRIWSVAYPYYPYKVLWHDGCQGYFEIWKELETNVFYIECDECSLQFKSIEQMQQNDYICEPLGLSVYPTMEEIKKIGWEKHIIKE